MALTLYLVRHGIAADLGVHSFRDEDRPLTEEGIARMQSAAQGLKKFLDPPDVIASSTLLRAKQTAEILAAALQPKNALEVWPDLSPGSAPHLALPLLKERTGAAASIMLVGHEPHVAGLTALLLGTQEHAVTFKKGAICALMCPRVPAPRKAELLWFLTPKQQRLLA